MVLVPDSVAREFLPGEGGAIRPENESLFSTFVRGAERFVINRTGRNFTPDPAPVGDPPEDVAPPTVKTFRVPRSGSVRVPDLREVTSITFGGLAITANVYELVRAPTDEYPAIFVDLIGSSGYVAFDVMTVAPYATRPMLTITGRWGITPVPDDITVAICMLAARMFARRDARYADAVQAGIESAAFNYYRSLPDEIKTPVEMLRVKKVAFA